MPKPFEIESSDINRLNAIQLTQLLKKLLHAEAYKFGIAQHSVEVALNITVGDGGEDGRISWNGGVDHTDYIPNRLTMFQNKATDMNPSKYASEIMTKGSKSNPSKLKPKVEEILDSLGSYIIFTTQELNSLDKETRIAAVRNQLSTQGKTYADTCDIKIYDASDIAGWTNQFITTIVSVQHWLGIPTERGLKSYDLWSEHEDLSVLPFVAIESRKAILQALTDQIAEPKSCFRIMGLSGIGKTRSAFEIFKTNEALRERVIYVDANQTPRIDALVADWIGLKLEAILVVDNCEFRLHENLAREVCRTESKISLLTLDYNFESVTRATKCFTLKPMEQDEIKQLLSPTYGNQLKDLDRIATFAQGFPQMAVLLAEARLADDPNLGRLSEDDIADKLLWRRDEAKDAEKLKILQACSLFDNFGIEKEAESQLDFISHLTGINADRFYECIQYFSERGIIDRRGRFGQVVPKPLAIRLAGQWWENNRDQKHFDLVNGLPEDMTTSFCQQIKKLDFHPNVKKLTEKLCGHGSPFGQAEVILSTKGSRLFRAFANVNPEATTNALFSTLKERTQTQLLEITNDVRRNLVWALECLCYHESVFNEAAKCLLLLASAENETWSNNATGMFAQLYRVHLSGTAAKPDLRFRLVEDALRLNSQSIDMVLIGALRKAINDHGGTRTIGAEYQGTKPPLEEWHPIIWQEIFDFWQRAIDLLIVLAQRGTPQKEKVLECIGHSIRPFVSRGRLEMLDKAIREIVSINGQYWPAAKESILNVFQYDSKEMTDETSKFLNDWLDLLNPRDAALDEKLKILVIDPPDESRIDDSGGYIDVSSDNARKFAQDVAKKIECLYPFIELLLHGSQRQTFAFAYELSIQLDHPEEFLNSITNSLPATDNFNPSLILGFLKGLFERSPILWQSTIDRLVTSCSLIEFYPNFVCTGKIEKSHLDKLITLIRSESVPLIRANAINYALDSLAAEEVADFCIKLSDLSQSACWAALKIVYSFCHSNSEKINSIKPLAKELIIKVSFNRDITKTHNNAHIWRVLSEKLLSDHDKVFAEEIARQLINSCRSGLNHSDILHYIKPILMHLMREYCSYVWPIFGHAIVQAEGMERYWLQQLLDSDTSLAINTPSVLTEIPVDSVIKWCLNHQEVGPVFVAGCVNVLEKKDEEVQFSPLCLSLLDNFGNDEKVTGAIWANLNTRGWSGSLVPLLETDKRVLSTLLSHSKPEVIRWAKDRISYTEKQIENETTQELENSFRR